MSNGIYGVIRFLESEIHTALKQDFQFTEHPEHTDTNPTWILIYSTHIKLPSDCITYLHTRGSLQWSINLQSCTSVRVSVGLQHWKKAIWNLQKSTDSSAGQELNSGCRSCVAVSLLCHCTTWHLLQTVRIHLRPTCIKFNSKECQPSQPNHTQNQKICFPLLWHLIKRFRI